MYDPTTGKVRPSDTKDIAAWFIDSDFDSRSFFVRHAYFTRDQKPYESLQRALKAEIDPDAWVSLYATTSRPFPRPTTGTMAIKVINHYGDEIVETYGVEQTALANPGGRSVTHTREASILPFMPVEPTLIRSGTAAVLARRHGR